MAKPQQKEETVKHPGQACAHDLLRLLPLWPHEVADQSPAGRQRILTLVRRALRAERQRGLAGHWTYDLSRHAQLLALYRRECGHDSGAKPLHAAD